MVDYGVATSSAREYAKVLRPFLRFCRERNQEWQSVDDAFLTIWREHMLRSHGVSIGRVNTSLKTIFAFYRWAEESKRIRFQVGIYAEGESPIVTAHVEFPISAKRTFTKGRQGRVFCGWTTPLTLSEPRQSAHVRHTPTEDEIRSLHEIAVERLHGERDSLMFSWAEETGARRAEFMQVRKSHMPRRDQLADLIERDEAWTVLVKRKGGGAKPLHVPPDLIVRTLDYIQFARRDIVSLCMKSIVGYHEPEEVFLSSTTGAPLHLDSVTSISRKTFGKAGVKNASIHRLRAKYAVRTIESLVDVIFNGDIVGSESSWVETILVKASEMMGHTSPTSLRPYLTYVLNRRMQVSDAVKAEKLATRVRQLELYESTLLRRLERR